MGRPRGIAPEHQNVPRVVAQRVTSRVPLRGNPGTPVDHQRRPEGPGIARIVPGDAEVDLCMEGLLLQEGKNHRLPALEWVAQSIEGPPGRERPELLLVAVK